MFKGKEVQVALVGKAKETYLELKSIIKHEKKQSGNKILLNSINRTIERLKTNPQFGIHIKKDNIPKYYINKYSVENLWKCNLANFWRMIYWINGSYEVKIVCFALDIIDHNLYNKRFGYKKT